MIFFNKTHCRFFAYSLNPGDIIGRVAHQRLYVYKFVRRNMISFTHCVLIIDGRFVLPHARDGKNYLCSVSGKLQIVLVTGSNKTFGIVFAAYTRNSADYIVRLKAFLFKNRYTHRS